MSSSKRPLLPNDAPPAKQRKCGVCCAFGHDKRTCPVNRARQAQNPSSTAVGDANDVDNQQPPPENITILPNAPPIIDWDRVIYVVFDLETTGRQRQKDEIIELAACVLDPNGIQIEDAVFVEYVKPTSAIPTFITSLTSITNEDVNDADGFAVVGDAFVRFMKQCADEFCATEATIEHVILVGHNSKVFDIPFLVEQLCRYQMADAFLGDKRFGLGLDTLKISREAVKRTNLGIPTAYNLSALFQFVTGTIPPTWHRAMADVKATSTIFRFDPFWEHRKEYVFQFHQPVVAIPEGTNEDSDTSVSSGDSDSSSSTGDDEVDNIPRHIQGDNWEVGVDYEPATPKPSELFLEHNTSRGRSQKPLLGVQCSHLDVNTPIRAWREIFKVTLLEKSCTLH
jgi:DNA polymerase III epsilon subunit-like protein